MPGDIFSTDLNFPSWSDEEPVGSRVEKIKNYLFIMREQLGYTLDNLGGENFNDAALQNVANSILSPVRDQLQSMMNLVTELAGQIESAELSVTNGTAASTIKLMIGGAEVSSVNIAPTDMLTETALASLLSTTGESDINADNLTSGSVKGIPIKTSDGTGTYTFTTSGIYYNGNLVIATP